MNAERLLVVSTRSFAVSAALVCALLSSTASADEPPSADTLFREGRDLLDRGQFDAACEKLAASQRLDPSSGTLLNLAYCHEAQGKLATASSEYRATERLSRAQGRDGRADEAHRRAVALDPRLQFVTVRVTSWVEGIEVRCDGEAIGRASLGAPTPIDPGEHIVSATALGYKPWSRKFESTAGTFVVEVPRLEREDGPATLAPPPAVAPAPAPSLALEPVPGARDTSHHGPSNAPWWIGGGGVAVLGAGAVFGVLALNDYSAATSACPSHSGCNTDAVTHYDRAQTEAWVANIGIGAGIVVVGVVAVWLLTHRAAPAQVGMGWVGGARE